MMLKAGKILLPGGIVPGTVRALPAGLVGGFGLPVVAAFSDGVDGNMGKDGSGSPIVFSATAIPGFAFAVHRITLMLGYSPGNGDTYSGGDFGTIGALANGLRLTYAPTGADADWDIIQGGSIRAVSALSGTGADVTWLPSTSGEGVLQAVWDCERCFGGPLVITDGGAVKWWVEDDLDPLSGYIYSTGQARVVAT